MINPAKVVQISVTVSESGVSRSVVIDALLTPMNGLTFVWEWNDESRTSPKITCVMPEVRKLLIQEAEDYYRLEKVVISRPLPDPDEQLSPDLPQ